MKLVENTITTRLILPSEDWRQEVRVDAVPELSKP